MAKLICTHKNQDALVQRPQHTPVHVCVHVLHVSIGALECVYSCWWRPKVSTDVFPNNFSTFLLGAGFTLDLPELSRQAGWWPRQSTRFFLPEPGLQRLATRPGSFTMVLPLKLRSLCFCSKHFYQQNHFLGHGYIYVSETFGVTRTCVKTQSSFIPLYSLSSWPGEKMKLTLNGGNTKSQSRTLKHFKIISLSVCGWFACMDVCAPGVCVGLQRPESDPLELEFWTVVSWVLETELRSSGRQARSLNCWIIFPAQNRKFKSIPVSRSWENIIRSAVANGDN